MIMYSDERMHTGKLSSLQVGTKPDLIILLKSKRKLTCGGVVCSEQEYLDEMIPFTNPLRMSFNSLQLVQLPG